MIYLCCAGITSPSLTDKSPPNREESPKTALRHRCGGNDLERVA
jgi:hypothetical protein